MVQQQHSLRKKTIAWPFRHVANEELNKVQKELADTEVVAISADVSLAKDVENLVQAVVAKWGQIDVLVHAAGVIYSLGYQMLKWNIGKNSCPFNVLLT